MTQDQGPTNVAVQGGQILPSMRHNNHVNNPGGGAPPAHQSPKNSQGIGGPMGGARGTTRPAPPQAEPQYMLISSPKKTRYSTTSMGLTPTTSNPSILRNQLISKVDTFYIDLDIEKLHSNQTINF
jgi:hypothetical protein